MAQDSGVGVGKAGTEFSRPPEAQLVLEFVVAVHHGEWPFSASPLGGHLRWPIRVIVFARAGQKPSSVGFEKKTGVADGIIASNPKDFCFPKMSAVFCHFCCEINHCSQQLLRINQLISFMSLCKRRGIESWENIIWTSDVLSSARTFLQISANAEMSPQVCRNVSRSLRNKTAKFKNYTDRVIGR